MADHVRLLRLDGPVPSVQRCLAVVRVDRVEPPGAGQLELRLAGKLAPAWLVGFEGPRRRRRPDDGRRGLDERPVAFPLTGDVLLGRLELAHLFALAHVLEHDPDGLVWERDRSHPVRPRPDATAPLVRDPAKVGRQARRDHLGVTLEQAHLAGPRRDVDEEPTNLFVDVEAGDRAARGVRVDEPERVGVVGVFEAVDRDAERDLIKQRGSKGLVGRREQAREEAHESEKGDPRDCGRPFYVRAQGAFPLLGAASPSTPTGFGSPPPPALSPPLPPYASSGAPGGQQRSERADRCPRLDGALENAAQDVCASPPRSGLADERVPEHDGHAP